MVVWPEWLPKEKQEQALLLVNRVRVFHYFLDMGMLRGPLGKKEACRRNAEIVNLRQAIGINKSQQTLLVNILAITRHPFDPPSMKDL